MAPLVFERSRYDAASNKFARVLSEVANEEPPFEVSGVMHERSTGSLLKASICFSFAHAINLWNKSRMFVCVGTGWQRSQVFRVEVCSAARPFVGDER